MGKKSRTVVAPTPQADPALEAQINGLRSQVDMLNQRSAAEAAAFRQRETALLASQAQLIERQAASDALAKELTATNQKMVAANETAARMQIPVERPDAPVTEISDDAAAVADAQRRRVAASTSRRNRSSLLIPLAPSGSATGLVIPR